MEQAVDLNLILGIIFGLLSIFLVGFCIAISFVVLSIRKSMDETDRRLEDILNKRLKEILLDLKGNHLRVGRDVVVNPLAIALELRLKFLVVIDISIETGMNDAAFWGLVAAGLIIDGMAVCLGNGTHRRPAGVGRYRVK